MIRAFNADKPYDRFLVEQIAGDELVDYEHAPEITQEIEDDLVATGFLRMAPDPTWANPTNFLQDRVDIIADEMDVFGSAVLGLTLKCARCHSHKFDPIPQRDYYRLLAVFKGAYDENDWLRSNWHKTISMGRRCDRELPYVTTAERRKVDAHNAPLKREIEALAAADRGPLPNEIAALEAKLLPEPSVRALWDRGEASPTYVYRRGDPLTPGPLVGPGVPSVLTDGRTPFDVTPPYPGARSTGRRLALARWLTKPDNPLTARVLVNRVWAKHFGVGLVATPGNFGKAGAAPTHPALLDWLATRFVRDGWTLKALHRLVVTSAAYRQASDVTEASRKGDPDGRLYSRRAPARLDAEALQDSLYLIAGRLDPTPFGPPDPVTVRADGLVTASGTDRGWRRSIYLRQDRKQVATLLEAFDLPQMNPNCLERRDSNVAPQALHLWNDGQVRELAARFARRMASDAGGDPGRRVDLAFTAALGRPPTAGERAAALDALGRLEAQWRGRPAGDAPADRALSDVCHALLNSAAFFIHRLRGRGATVSGTSHRTTRSIYAGVNRRDFLHRVAGGVYGAALSSLLGRDLFAAEPFADLSPRRPRVEPKAKAVIQLFMNGGPSPMDLFDPKPMLDKHHGKPLFDKIAGEVENAKDAGTLMRSPFKFARHGGCGMWVSDALPHIARQVDDIALIRSMFTTNLTHEPAVYLIQTGKTGPGRPSLGSWVVYGLGSENQNLPAYVVLDDPLGLPINGVENWQSGFLPPVFQGTRFRSTGSPVLNLRPDVEPPAGADRAERDLLSRLDRDHLAGR